MWTKFTRELAAMGMVEWLAIIACVIVGYYYLSLWGYSFRALILIVLMAVSGFMAGSMLAPLWLGVRVRKCAICGGPHATRDCFELHDVW